MPTSTTALTKAFGLVLRDFRKGAGLSQETLVYRANLSRNYISELELGSKTPSLSAIELLAAALGTRPHVLIKAAEERAG